MPRVATFVAKSYIGAREEGGKNRGPEVDVFNRRAGSPRASAWCAGFVYYCFDSAAIVSKVKNPLLKTGAVWRQLQYARQLFSRLEVIPLGGLFASAALQAGDIGCLSNAGVGSDLIGDDWLGHMILVERDKGETVIDVEGNTNVKGAREGVMVMRRERKKNTLLAAIRTHVPVEEFRHGGRSTMIVTQP